MTNSAPATLCCECSTLPSASLTSAHDGPLKRSFKSGGGAASPEDAFKRASAIVRATRHYNEPDVIAEVSRGLGEAMVGINVADIPVHHRLEDRGW